MQSTANYVLEEGVLKAGQVIPSITDVELLKKKETRVYYHAVKGANTHMPDGATICFRGGMFATDNKDVIEHLEKIVDQPGSMVFSGDRAAALAEVEKLRAADLAAAPAGDAAKGMA